ncbi:MAG: hypothetical protein KAT15_31450, partial [Bacteroidales bacterium]|nr:hypothetical protein [Bacteroidales bacterium]
MKKIFFSLLLFTLINGTFYAQTLKPYTLGAVSELGISEASALVRENLKAIDFKVLGEYMPAADVERWLIVITSEELISAAGKVGGLTGFAAALRVGLTLESGKVNISYTTPEYWLNAYYRDDFEKVESVLAPVSERLITVMKG